MELHVLAQNGDSGASAVAARWCATDPDARHTWDTVERTCELVRDGEGTDRP